MKEVKSAAVEEYYNAFCFLQKMPFHPREKGVTGLLAYRGSPESVSASDIHNNVNTVLESVHLLILLNLKPFYFSVTLVSCYVNSLSGLWLQSTYNSEVIDVLIAHTEIYCCCDPS